MIIQAMIIVNHKGWNRERSSPAEVEPKQSHAHQTIPVKSNEITDRRNHSLSSFHWGFFVVAMDFLARRRRRNGRRSRLVGIFEEDFAALIRFDREDGRVMTVEKIVGSEVGVFVGDDALEELNGGGVDRHAGAVGVGGGGEALAHGALDGDLQVRIDVLAQKRRHRRRRRRRFRRRSQRSLSRSRGRRARDVAEIE